MWMTKYLSTYINVLPHRHGHEIYINNNGFKRHERFSNNVMFEFSWTLQARSNASDQEGLSKCLVHESEEETEETGLETVDLSNGGKSA